MEIYTIHLHLYSVRVCSEARGVGGARGVRGLTCDGSDWSVLGVGVGATAGVDAAPLPEETDGVSGGSCGAGTLGGACPTAHTVSGECRIGVEPEGSSRRGEGRRKGRD